MTRMTLATKKMTKKAIGKIVTKRKKRLMDLDLLFFILFTSIFHDNFVTANITDTSNNSFTDIDIFF